MTASTEVPVDLQETIWKKVRETYASVEKAAAALKEAEHTMNQAKNTLTDVEKELSAVNEALENAKSVLSDAENVLAERKLTRKKTEIPEGRPDKLSSDTMEHSKIPKTAAAAKTATGIETDIVAEKAAVEISSTAVTKPASATAASAEAIAAGFFAIFDQKKGRYAV